MHLGRFSVECAASIPFLARFPPSVQPAPRPWQEISRVRTCRTRFGHTRRKTCRISAPQGHMPAHWADFLPAVTSHLHTGRLSCQNRQEGCTLNEKRADNTRCGAQPLEFARPRAENRDGQNPPTPASPRNLARATSPTVAPTPTSQPVSSRGARTRHRPHRRLERGRPSLRRRWRQSRTHPD